LEVWAVLRLVVWAQRVARCPVLPQELRGPLLEQQAL
jgi:hypothetical protein